MSSQNLTNLLKQTSHELVALAMAELIEATAEEIRIYTRLPIGAVYEILVGMEAKGLVQVRVSGSGRPHREATWALVPCKCGEVERRSK